MDPSPWPIVTSFALLTLTVSAVLYFHGYPYGGDLLTLGFALTLGGMILWFRDVVQEGKTITSVAITFSPARCPLALRIQRRKGPWVCGENYFYNL